jgi:hypothetical protein
MNIKSVIIVVLYFIVLQSPAFSQARSTIGIKAGGGFSRYYFIRADRQSIKQSFIPIIQYGLVFSQINQKNLGIQCEIIYIQKGWTQNFDNSLKSYAVKLDNIEVPFLTHFRIGKNKTSFLINMGLHFSYSYNASVDSAGVTTDSLLVKYNNSSITPFDYGIDGGIGFEFGRDRGIFQVQLMFSQGLRNFIDRNKQNPLVVARSLNQCLSLSCIYKIPLSRRKKDIIN